MTKISHEHRCKNPHQTTGKPNLATFGDLYTMMKWNLSQECKLGLRNIKKKKKHIHFSRIKDKNDMTIPTASEKAFHKIQHFFMTN